MEFVSPVKYRSEGFYSWSELDIVQYQNHHPVGSMARLALELMLWTAKRPGDAAHIGRQHIKNGYIFDTDNKTGKRSWIRIAQPLQVAINAMPQHDHMTLLISEWDRPFSTKGFQARFKKWCVEAGLPQCSAHGLRKAMLRRMAELDISNAGIKSISQHENDREVAGYVRDAQQKKMADNVMSQLEEWQKCLTDEKENCLTNEIINE